MSLKVYRNTSEKLPFILTKIKKEDKRKKKKKKRIFKKL